MDLSVWISSDEASVLLNSASPQSFLKEETKPILSEIHKSWALALVSERKMSFDAEAEFS